MMHGHDASIAHSSACHSSGSDRGHPPATWSSNGVHGCRSKTNLLAPQADPRNVGWAEPSAHRRTGYHRCSSSSRSRVSASIFDRRIRASHQRSRALGGGSSVTWSLSHLLQGLFCLQPRTFATEAVKVVFAVTYLTIRARLWGAEEWEGQTPICSSFQVFAAELRKVFGHGSFLPAVADELLTLCQGQRSVVDYAVEFWNVEKWNVTSRSSWPVAPLANAFLHGLADYIKDVLFAYEIPASLDGVIDLAIQVDQSMQAGGHSRQVSPPFLIAGSQGF